MWLKQVEAMISSVKMKIDTGEEATVVSKDVHEAIGSPPLQMLDKILQDQATDKSR